ncbi:PEX7 Peroxisomal targeting signal 2 receptor [Candida maltosa Xu316]
MNNDLTTKISSAVPLSNQPQHQGINTSHCVYSAKFSPHAPWQIISCSGAGKVQIWDIRDRKPLQMEYVAHGGFECLSVAPNFYKPEVIASAGSNGSIHLWDLRLISSTPHIRGPSPLNELLGHQFAVRNIKFSPHNANELVSASYDMSCRVWQDSSQERARFLNAGAATVGIFPQHKEFVMDCDYSLWGQPGWIASTGWDEMVYVWDSNRFRV